MAAKATYSCETCRSTEQWSCVCWQFSGAARWQPDQTERERWVRPERREPGWERRFERDDSRL